MSEAKSVVAEAQRTLLVVDDQPSVCVAIAYYLECSGFRALRAESGMRALELARAEPVDGVLLDVHMPVINGVETCRRLRAQAAESGRPLKVWFMTGAISREIRQICEQAGGRGVFQKPFDWPQLLNEIGGQLGAPPAADTP